ncbi:MAG: hypothetical protein RLZZ502_398, partial [Pseudomonadota bacterium]
MKLHLSLQNIAGAAIALVMVQGVA